MNANSSITKIVKSSVGEYKVKDLEIDGEQIPVVTEMATSGDGSAVSVEVNGEELTLGVKAFSTVLGLPVDDASDSTSGIIFLIDTDGKFIDTFDKLEEEEIETLLYLTSTGIKSFSTLSIKKFKFKYGENLSNTVASATFTTDVENRSIYVGTSVFEWANNAAFTAETVFELLTLYRTEL